MNFKSKIYSISFLLMASLISYSQDDLEKLLEQSVKPTTEEVSATFKGTRIINGHSIERMKKGQLDYRISHRFGPVSSGPYDFFGLDQSTTMHFSLEYGLTNWLMAGIGRSAYDKTYDGDLKFSIIRQTKGARTIPVSLSYLAGIYVNSTKWDDPSRKNYFYSRLAFVHQILIARKFNEHLSLEVNPTFIHRNLVKTALDPNDFYAIGLGGRYKFTKRIALCVEYYYIIPPINNHPSFEYYNPLSIGVDIETGGHVFQLHFTNSHGMTDKGIIGETSGSWKKGDIHFGFNISRVFTLN